MPDAVCPMFDSGDESISALFISFFGVFLAVIFDLFVTCMFVDQVCCIVDDMSTIDKLKRR
jgi:hypothetical protein